MTNDNSRYIATRPEYLNGFSEHCIKRFDVHWVIGHLEKPELSPTWFRHILTLMLLGWIFAPRKKIVRISLAMHQLNEIIHKSVIAAKSKQKTKSYWNAISDATDQFSRNIRWIYGDLGGFQSKELMSWDELNKFLEKKATDGEACLYIFDIAVTRFQNPNRAERFIPREAAIGLLPVQWTRT